MNEHEFEQFHLTDAQIVAILMHREVHFGGNFGVMLEYYAQGGKGVDPEFDIDIIQQLADRENEMKQDLASFILTGPEAEKVARAKKAYHQLRDLYEIKNPISRYPVLIADLILSEKEDPQEEIEAIVKEKGSIVPSLIQLIKSEDFHDPLFPGYGLAPGLAMQCLANIGDKRAIITFFEGLGTGDFFEDDTALKGLRVIGKPAQEFLLGVLKGKPWNEDNEKAAMALIGFKEDPEVLAVCLNMLQDPEILKNIVLSTYLILVCEGLQDKSQRESLASLGKRLDFPKVLQQDLNSVIKSWAS